MTAPPRPRLVVYTRAGCHACDEMIAELSRRLAGRAVGVEIRDVDADPETRRRYGLKVPVLTIDGQPACSGRLDEDALDGLP